MDFDVNINPYYPGCTTGINIDIRCLGF